MTIPLTWQRVVGADIANSIFIRNGDGVAQHFEWIIFWKMGWTKQEAEWKFVDYSTMSRKTYVPGKLLIKVK